VLFPLESCLFTQCGGGAENPKANALCGNANHLKRTQMTLWAGKSSGGLKSFATFLGLWDLTEQKMKVFCGFDL
jgi:hypothetical protein